MKILDPVKLEMEGMIGDSTMKRIKSAEDGGGGEHTTSNSQKVAPMSFKGNVSVQGK